MEHITWNILAHNLLMSDDTFGINAQTWRSVTLFILIYFDVFFLNGMHLKSMDSM